jgi:hypothetical protein
MVDAKEYNEINIMGIRPAVDMDNIPVDIAALTLGTLDVNLAGQDANVNVNLAGQDEDIGVSVTNTDSLRTYSRRPASSTQVFSSLAANNSTGTIYTVPTGKTLYLCDISFLVYNTSGSPCFCYMALKDSGGGVKWNINYTHLTGDGSHNFGLSFPIPIEIPEAYYFVISSNVANAYTSGMLHGFLL